MLTTRTPFEKKKNGLTIREPFGSTICFVRIIRFDQIGGQTSHTVLITPTPLRPRPLLSSRRRSFEKRFEKKRNRLTIRKPFG